MGTDEPDQTRDERLITSVTGNQKQEIRIEAATQGITMSEYVYRAVLKQLERDRDEGNGNPSPIAIPN